jgi:hypothetical protein
MILNESKVLPVHDVSSRRRKKIEENRTSAANQIMTEQAGGRP